MNPRHQASQGTIAPTVARLAVAGVWWYEGLWCKVLGDTAHQRSIVASLPGLPTTWVTTMLVGIGLAETALGIWVASGNQPRLAAVAQTVLLVCFNAGGLLFAGQRVADPGQMLTQNAVLLSVVWLLSQPAAPEPLANAASRPEPVASPASRPAHG